MKIDDIKLVDMNFELVGYSLFCYSYTLIERGKAMPYRFLSSQPIWELNLVENIAEWSNTYTVCALVFRARNLRKITSNSGLEIHRKLTGYLGQKSFEYQCVFSDRNLLKITSNSGLEIY